MSKLKKSKGFTLIELLIALTIVSTILLAFFKVTDSTTKMNVKNDLDIKALNLAQSEIENLRNKIKSGEEVDDYSCKKSIDDKEFNINLDISKSEVNTSKNNLSKELYIYTINITVKPDDIYFSKKPTELKGIKILSKNS